MISLDTCSGSCNVLSAKNMCSPKKIKDINVKVFNMITNKNEARTMLKHISCDCKCKFNRIVKHVNMTVKISISTKKTIVGNLGHVFVRTASIYKVLLIFQ